MAWIKQRVPCPCGKGQNNSALDESGWLTCFRCKKSFKLTGNSSNTQINKDTQKNKPYRETDMIPNATDYKALPKRSLTQVTAEKYKVACATSHNKKCIVFPYYNDKGEIVAQKVRYSSGSNKYEMLGDSKFIMSHLFGSHLWNTGGLKIVITEGELDCLALSQVQGHKYPTVSLPSGAGSAKKVLASNKDWLQDNFKEIILMFDMDDAGQSVIPEAVKIFDNPKQVKIAKLPLKDANEMLLAGRSQELVRAVFNAIPYRPKGLVSINDIRDLINAKPEMGQTYPWESLTRWTYGLGRPELNVWCAGTGMGKTLFFKNLAAHVIKKYNAKVGMILLEESPQKTAVGLAGNYLGTRFDSPLIEFDEADLGEALDGLEDKVILNQLDGRNEWSDVQSKIRHMIVAEGCDYIFLDHLTKFADNAGDGKENSMLQGICSSLSDMAMELNANINCISHLRKVGTGQKSFEEGGHISLDDIKGSGSIKQYAWSVFSLERDKHESTEALRNVTKITLLKCRNAGENEGEQAFVKYDVDTGMLKEVDRNLVLDNPSDLVDNASNEF